MGNSVMAWVVGLIIPSWLPRASANQRLPSGPAVISKGRLSTVGMGNSVMAWVVGLIIPTTLGLSTVSQRLPSGPAVIIVAPPLATGVGVKNSLITWVVGLIV